MARLFSQHREASLDFEEKLFCCSVSSEHEDLPGKRYGNYWTSVFGALASELMPSPFFEDVFLSSSASVFTRFTSFIFVPLMPQFSFPSAV